MKVSMTAKDRNLLVGILCAAILIIFYQLIMVPGFQDIQDTKAQLEEALGEKEMMLMQLEMTANIEETISNNIAKRTELASPYLDQIWETRRMDKMITDTILTNKLFPDSLALTIPELKMVDYYVLAQPSEEELAGQEELEPRFTNLANVRLRAKGTKTECNALIDALVANTALKLNSFELTDLDDNNQAEITCDVTVIMCAEGVDRA